MCACGVRVKPGGGECCEHPLEQREDRRAGPDLRAGDLTNWLAKG